jgi:hypothetical protein
MADGWMPDYRYELRRSEEVIATGHLSREQPLEVGERIAIGSHSGIVRAIDPLLHDAARSVSGSDRSRRGARG